MPDGHKWETASSSVRHDTAAFNSPRSAVLSCPGRRLRRRDVHWFWRAVIALGIGAHLAAPIRGELTIWFSALMTRQGSPTLQAIGLFGVFGVGIITVALSTVPVYMLLGRFIASPAPYGETRCRKCNYILRGLTEPRCPECGERI